MKRFIFRLDRVLKIKEQRQRVAELRQQQARLAVENIRAEMAALANALRTTAAALETQVGRTVPVGAWASHYVHSTQIGERLRAAEARLQRAVAELEAAAALRTKITTEVEALLTLRDRQWQDHCDEDRALRQNQLDELALSRWQALHRR